MKLGGPQHSLWLWWWEGKFLPDPFLGHDLVWSINADGPVAWPGRIRCLHLKDWAPGTAAEEKAYRVLFTEGVSPWPQILAAAEATGGVEYYLMEQEGSRYPEFETARRCLENWKTLRKGT